MRRRTRSTSGGSGLAVRRKAASAPKPGPDVVPDAAPAVARAWPASGSVPGEPRSSRLAPARSRGHLLRGPELRGASAWVPLHLGLGRAAHLLREHPERGLLEEEPLRDPILERVVGD